MMHFTDWSGLASCAIGLAAIGAVLAARLFSRRRGVVIAAALALLLVMLVPINGVPLAIYPRGVFGDLSITSTLLLLLAVVGRSGFRWNGEQLAASKPVLFGMLAALALMLYPFALGIGMYDPYRLGYGSPLFIATLVIVGAVALWRSHYLITITIVLSLLAWSFGWYESPNLWDYLIDPLVSVFAIGALIKKGADIHAKNTYGWTLLRHATWENADKTAALLIKKGADIHVRDKDGDTPLSDAALGNADKTAALLIEKGADIHAENKYGVTPLHYAAWGNADKTAALLIEKGADIHARDKDGDTPLHDAALGNADKTAALLIEKSADIHAKNKNGRTPLHHAAWENADETTALLIEKGADINARDDDGDTPLDAAKRSESDKVAKLLSWMQQSEAKAIK